MAEDAQNLETSTEDLNQTSEAVILNSILLTSTAEIYDPEFKIDLCLNDGSWYPKVVEQIKGKAFGHGFYNKTVLNRDE